MSSSSHAAKRRRWPLAEKRRIVELTMQFDASVQGVARRHGLHSTTLSHWKKLYRNGNLEVAKNAQPKPRGGATFLPITLEAFSANSISRPMTIGITMPSGISIRIEADSFDFTSLSALLALVPK